MFSRVHRLIIALIFSLLATSGALIIARAQEPPPTATTSPKMTYDSCGNCHQDIEDHMKDGPHGQAYTDPVFVDTWQSQGQPGACLVCHTTGYDPASGQFASGSVSCEACHGPIPDNHPTDNMPVDISPDLCGKCHSDPRFSTQNWQLSAHYQRDMTCSVCHDAHSAGMKTVAGASANQSDASDLCQNCHKDAMKNFPSSIHAEAGVTCVNCHLGFNVGTNSGSAANASFADIHKAPDHSFLPSLNTCNQCHATQMHAPGQAVAATAMIVEQAGGTATPVPTPVVTPLPPVSSEPPPTSPLGFAGLAALVGLAAGMVLAPWLERSYHRVVKQHHEEDSDERQ